METGTRMVAITTSLWLPSGSPSYSHYQNLSGICYFGNQNDPKERQVLWVLTTFQYQAEVGPKSPPPGHVTHSMQSIMQPLQQAGILFMPHAVLGYATLISLRSTSVETDISCADISLLPSSVGSAGDMPQCET